MEQWTAMIELGVADPERAGSYVADPDRHVREYDYNPFMPLAADGSLTLPSVAG